MDMDNEQRMLIRDMKHNSPGWKLMEKWILKQIDALTMELIDLNDEDKRGRIKGMKQILNKINLWSSK